MEFPEQNFSCMEIRKDSRRLSSLQTARRAAFISGSTLTSSLPATDNPGSKIPTASGLTTTSKKSRPVAVVGSRSDAHAAKLILVIFLVQDVPLLAALEDFLFLRSDSLADFQFDLLFFFQRGSQNLHHLLANGIAVVDEFHFCAFNKHVRDLVREPYDFFAGEAHRFSKSSHDLDIDRVKPVMQIPLSPKPQLPLAKNQLAKKRPMEIRLPKDQLAVPR